MLLNARSCTTELSAAPIEDRTNLPAQQGFQRVALCDPFGSPDTAVKQPFVSTDRAAG